MPNMSTNDKAEYLLHACMDLHKHTDTQMHDPTLSSIFIYYVTDLLSFCLPGSKAQYKLDLYAVWYDDAKVFFLTLLCHSAKTSFCNL